MSVEIQRCYDSHVHLLATGEVHSWLDLRSLKDPNDIGRWSFNESQKRGDWLLGFGWDQHQFPHHEFPTKDILDRFFPNIPVALTRMDGHASWVNSEALRRIGYLDKTEQEKPTPAGGLILRDSQGRPNGILIDMAKILIDFSLPPRSPQQIQTCLQKAISVFNQAGFTHVRDMGSQLQEFLILRGLEEKQELTIYLDLNFPCENLKDAERALSELKEARRFSSSQVRVAGLKIYYDGALGSEGALIGGVYQNSSRGPHHSGLVTWEISDVKQAITQAWKDHFIVSIHTLGDEAVDQVATAALEIQNSGLRGSINFEHVELLRDETLLKLKQLQARCHFQPCHWHTDRTWIEQKVGRLSALAFRWVDVEAHQIPLSFGSDSPIEESSLLSNFNAVEELAKKAGRLIKPFHFYHQHPDPSFGKLCKTIWNQDGRRSVYFNDQLIFTNE